MSALQILATGSSDPARANARGKLFEKIIAEVLRSRGYEIDGHTINVTHAGMEIDIEGRSKTTQNPLYAECKCYSTDVRSVKFQAFYAKYMTRWMRNSRSEGLFVALPGINSDALGFYKENCLESRRISVGLMQQPEVIDALISGHIVASPDTLEAKLGLLGVGTAGDRTLLCTDRGNFWLQYVVPSGSGVATKIQVFDSLGNPITDAETTEYIQQLFSEVSTFEMIQGQSSAALNLSAPAVESGDAVVELRGSSSCFEYQFPTSPAFFVGRSNLLEDVEGFASSVVDKATRCRGLLVEANSGWGKSSLVLAAVSRLRELGHFAIAVDSRSASTPLFVLKVVEHVLKSFGHFDGLIPSHPTLSGLETAADALIQIGRQLEEGGKSLFIFFDQFENTFYLRDVLMRIAQFCLKIVDAQTNVVLGFSWKTDFVGLTRDFPYRWRDIIIDSSQTIRLPQFSDTETDALLDKLAEELHTTLRKDLRFLLSEFSQGYPWLLKKLCAHVSSQRQTGVPLAEIARDLLNVEELFLDDLRGLTAKEEESLRRIAKLAPVSVSDFGEELEPDLVQSLIDRRLVVRVGSKYDVYWDIFRDYLNTGRLPIEEVYLLRSSVGIVLNAGVILNNAGGQLDTIAFKESARYSEGAVLNVARDLRLLQLADVTSDVIELRIPVGTSEETLLQNIRNHVQDRLPKNKCVHRVLQELNRREELRVEDLADVLQSEFPYISAISRTWRTYANVLAQWLDFSDLAVFDKSGAKLLKYEAGTQVRERTLRLPKLRSGLTVPSIHFNPVVLVANRLVTALQNGGPVDWSGIKRSTIYKSLAMLDQMKLIERRHQTLVVKEDCQTFARNPVARLAIAQSAVLAWPVVKTFIQVLMANSGTLRSHKELGYQLIAELKVSWQPSTATTNVKIMLDWVRHLELAPGVYTHSIRGRFRRAIQDAPMPLFGGLKEATSD